MPQEWFRVREPIVEAQRPGQAHHPLLPSRWEKRPDHQLPGRAAPYEAEQRRRAVHQSQGQFLERLSEEERPH